ncbi:MAG: hypothetical protein VB053_02550 [Oscillibacter ruminantium]|uniref:hypothetical protein n=1 Tax=Oscillibacter ruminantium TaxID=1263547 RepID=UPI002B1FFBA4|nr:hypothetical protein [Oscillibacter ruminantium]MEA5041400.1 hypothetical protein [Oscillibacter ruminantium]
MARKKGTSATRAKNKWNSENYDRLYPYVEIGKKEVYQKAVEAGGYDSLNDLIESATDEKALHALGWSKEEFDTAVQAAAEEERKRREKRKEHGL